MSQPNLTFVKNYFNTSKKPKVESSGSEEKNRLIQKIKFLECQNKDLQYENKCQSQTIESLKQVNSRNEELIQKLIKQNQVNETTTHNSKKKADLLTLPKNVLQQIFSYLPNSEVVWNVAFTCKALQCIAFEYVDVITIENDNPVQFVEQIKIILNMEEISRSLKYIFATLEDVTTEINAPNLLEEMKIKCKPSKGKILYLKQKGMNGLGKRKIPVWNEDTLFLIWKSCPQLKNVVAWGESFFLLKEMT